MGAEKEHKISATVNDELYKKCLQTVKEHKFKGIRSVTGLIEFALSKLLEGREIGVYPIGCAHKRVRSGGQE